MRKKVLIEQNFSLFEQIESLRAESALKDNRIKELEEQIKKLSEKSAEEKPKGTLPLKKLEEKVISNSKLSPDVEYASEAIGKLVLESAKGGSKLASGDNGGNRELINLLLGKTEVAKAEILSVVSEQAEFEDKKDRIDAVIKEALDYFESIMAQ